MRWPTPATPYRALRGSCGGCLFALLLGIVLLCALFWLAPHAGAAAAPHSIQLAPEYPEGGASDTVVGIFHRAHLSVTVPGGAIWLASTPDGRGALRTDDRARLTVVRPDGTHAVWEADFRSTDRQQIQERPAPDLAALFQSGAHEVMLELEDLWPPTYSSRPYYLVLAQPLTPTLTPVPPTPSRVPSRLPGEPEAERRLLLLVADPTDGTPSSPLTPPPRVWLWGGLGGLAVLGIVGVVRRRRQQPPPSGPVLGGWLSVWDRETGERLPLVNLATLPEGAVVQVEPLRLLPLATGGGAVTLYPTEAGVRLLVSPEWEGVPSALLAPGSVLRDGESWEIGRIALEYRHPAARLVAGRLSATS